VLSCTITAVAKYHSAD